MIKDVVQKSKKHVQKEEMLKVERWMVPNPYYIQMDKTLREAAKMMDCIEGNYIPVVSPRMQPIGIITTKMLLNYLLNGKGESSVLSNFSSDSFSIVRSSDSLLDIYALPYTYFSVVDDQSSLVGVLSRSEILEGLSWYIKELNDAEHTTEILDVVLESAYEGVTVVDEEGIILEFNEAYSRFTGIKREAAVGRHVTDVIDNTNLHNTVKTALPERGVIQNIQGQTMFVHRIPICKGDRVIGAIGMVIFEGVTEVYRIYERLQNNTIQITSKQQSNKKSFKINKREGSKVTLDQIIGDSESTSSVKRLARKVAKTDVPVLISGETGTGKEMYAKSIHHLSAFSSGSFISVNCGAIPDHLFESELFGYEEGAFTGAKKGGKPGKFGLAQNGTLFLDEIGEMPLMMQTKLLRVLQEKEVERIGGIQRYKINTRIIAATNQNLKEMVAAGKFREDLYYRIHVIGLSISPLRERVEDIPPLIFHYLDEICTKYQIPLKSLSSGAMSAFLNYRWDGNIRELVNTIERTLILVEGEKIDIQDLPDYLIDRNGFQEDPKNTTPIRQAKHFSSNREKELIVSVLKKMKGNKSKAAEQLGIHRTTLYQKLKKYNIDNNVV